MNRAPGLTTKAPPQDFPSVLAQGACPVCGGWFGAILSERDRDGGPLTTFLCADCGLARTDPMPSEAELARYYASEYRLDYKGVITPRKRHVLRAGRLARERLKTLADRLKAGAAILDVGAGGGEFVGVARAGGFAARGLEPNAGYADYATTVLQLPLERATWQDACIEAGSLDAVTMFHVLEHLPNPLICLCRVLEWLRPGGLLVVEVPNLVAPLGTRSRRFHRAHLLHFTPKTLSTTLSVAGFEVELADAPGDGGNARILARKPTSAEGAPPTGRDERRPSPGASALDFYRFEKSLARTRRTSGPLVRRFTKRMLRAAEEPFTASRFTDGQAILKALSDGRL